MNDKNIEVHTNFGALVKSLRLEKGWSVKQFIDKLGIKVSQSYITRIELHNEIPAPRVVMKIAIALNYDILTLFKIAKKNKLIKYKEELDRKYKVRI